MKKITLVLFTIIFLFPIVGKAQDMSVKKITLQNFKVSVYPNPNVDGILTIDFNQEIKKIEIYNILGQKTKMEIRACDFKNSSSLCKDISNLTSGVYLLKIISINGDKITRKIIKK